MKTKIMMKKQIPPWELGFILFTCCSIIFSLYITSLSLQRFRLLYAISLPTILAIALLSLAIAIVYYFIGKSTFSRIRDQNTKTGILLAIPLGLVSSISLISAIINPLNPWYRMTLTQNIQLTIFTNGFTWLSIIGVLIAYVRYRTKTKSF